MNSEETDFVEKRLIDEMLQKITALEYQIGALKAKNAYLEKVDKPRREKLRRYKDGINLLLTSAMANDNEGSVKLIAELAVLGLERED